MNSNSWPLIRLTKFCLRSKASPFLAVFLLNAFSVQAQWQTQSILVKPGWNAVYLHVDASYISLDNLVAGDPNNPISEIWLWLAPSSSQQFVTSPQQPLSSGAQWAKWVRSGQSLNGNLTMLIPNAAYLIRSRATTDFTWQLRGKPAAPNYAWASSGLNLLGFPTPGNGAPLFQDFLTPAPNLKSSSTAFYLYPGGDLGANNPIRLRDFQNARVQRGQAFWIGPTTPNQTLFNNYFGPFQVNLNGTKGVDFGDSFNQFSVRLSNVTSSNLTVSVRLLPSETPPAGSPAIVGPPPVLVRGGLIVSNLTHSYTALSGGTVLSWNLPPQGQPGSDLTVIFGLNRYLLSGNQGDLFAGILQFTDSFGFSEVNIPVSAQVGSYAGLWIGNATLSQVANYLKIYQRDANNQPVIGDPTNGNYVVANINTNLGPVAPTASFPLRFILHNDGTNVVLLQRVFYGMGLNSNTVVATSESVLDQGHLGNARRISAINWPWSAANTGWQFSGQLVPGGSLTNVIPLAYDDQGANPFLHTYHPDHDNLNSTFNLELSEGAESYAITRVVTLTVGPPGGDFDSLTKAGQAFYGIYQESVTLEGQRGSRTFNTVGTFALNRISPIAQLTRP